MGIICCYAGPAEEAEAAYAPLRELGPALDMLQPMPYSIVQKLIEPGNPPGLQNYWSADFLADLPDEAVDILAEHTARVTSPMTQIILVPMGGAISRVPEDAMAFGQRKAPWNIHYLGMWPDAADGERQIGFIRELSQAMKPYTTGRAYLNFIGDEGGDRVEAAFGPEKYQKLVALKDRYDPQNLFKLNQNIPPSGRTNGASA